MKRLPSVDKSTCAWTDRNFNACCVLVSGLRPVGLRPAVLPAPKFQAARFQRKFAERIFASVQGGWARRSGATVSEENKAQKQRSLCKPCVPLSTEGKVDIGKILRLQCERKGIEIIEAECCPDHIHMLIKIPPKYSVSYIARYLKGKSSLTSGLRWYMARRLRKRLVWRQLFLIAWPRFTRQRSAKFSQVSVQRSLKLSSAQWSRPVLWSASEQGGQRSILRHKRKLKVLQIIQTFFCDFWATPALADANVGMIF